MKDGQHEKSDIINDKATEKGQPNNPEYCHFLEDQIETIVDKVYETNPGKKVHRKCSTINNQQQRDSITSQQDLLANNIEHPEKFFGSLNRLSSRVSNRNIKPAIKMHPDQNEGDYVTPQNKYREDKEMNDRITEKKRKPSEVRDSQDQIRPNKAVNSPDQKNLGKVRESQDLTKHKKSKHNNAGHSPPNNKSRFYEGSQSQSVNVQKLKPMAMAAPGQKNPDSEKDNAGRNRDKGKYDRRKSRDDHFDLGETSLRNALKIRKKQSLGGEPSNKDCDVF